MTKPVIVTRAGKGSSLTWVEGDANFTNLQNATTGITDGTTTVTTDLNSAITVVPGTNISIALNNTAKTMTINNTMTSISVVQQNVQNQTGSTIPKGSVVYISGANGTNPLISLSQANTESKSSKTLGFTMTALNQGDNGYVITEGLFEGVDTLAATIGDPVWLSPTTAGGFVFGLSNKPVAPNHMVFLGIVVRVNQNNGAISVKVQNGFELEELHNVLAPTSGLSNNDILTWETSTSLWKNKQLASGQVTTALGFTPYNSTNPSGYTTNTGTVTSVAALTLGTTGTDVSSTVANGTTTPVITLNIPTASATNRGVLSTTDWSTFNSKQAALSNASSTVSGILTSTDWNTFNNKQATLSAASSTVSGYLTSTDWNTFNNKLSSYTLPTASASVLGGIKIGSGLSIDGAGVVTTTNSGTVTSVTGTAPVVSSGGSTPAISMAAATTSVSGYLTSTDWNTFNGKQAAFGSQTANTIYAAPNGSTGSPTFRAIVAADIPTLNQSTTGNASTATNIANGAANRILYQSGASTTAFMTAPSTTGTYLQWNGTSFTWATPASGSGTVTSVGGTGTVSGLTLSGTVTTTGNLTLGGTLAVTAGNFASQTANTVLIAPNGTAGTPTFRTLVAADIPALSYASTSVATTLANGLMSSSDKSKLDGVAAGATANTGTVTGVTGTAPVVSSGGTAPAISMAAATTSVSGYLTSTDWNTFNGKQAALGFTPYNATNPAGYTSNTGTVTNVTGSAPISVSSGTTTPSITISAATTLAAGSMSSSDKSKLDGIAAGATANTGTVTSVATSGTVSGLTLTGGTITTSGTITLGGTLAVTASNFASQTANTFLSAPNGTAGTPTFRAIVAADIPTLNQNTTGSSGSCTGNAATANTATSSASCSGNAATASSQAGGAANQISYQTAFSNTSFITAPTTASTYLQWNGTAFTWASAGGGSTTITDDVASNAAYYPTFVTASSGTTTGVRTSSTKLTFNPSSGTLTATNLQGAFLYPFNNQTTAYTLVAADGGKIVSFILTAAATCTLPAASSFPIGWSTTIANNSTSTSITAMILTIATASGTVDGLASFRLVRGESRKVISDGTNWQILSTNTMRGYSENITASGTLRVKATGVNAIALGYGTGTAASGANSFTFAQGPAISNTVAGGIAIGSYVNANQIGKKAWGPPGCAFGINTAQWSHMVLGAETIAGATTYVMTSDGNNQGSATPNGTNQLVIQGGSIMHGKGVLVGRMSGTGYVVYDVKFNALNNAGTYTMPVGTLTLYGTNTLAATTAPTMVIDTVNGCVKFTSGVKSTGTMIRWNAYIEYYETMVV